MCLFIVFMYISVSAAEETVQEVIPEPTLSPDADPYDPDHPENLSEDQLYALSAIVITADKGHPIFEKNADDIRYPASTTKILTVLLGIMFVDDLEQIVTVSETAVDVPPDSSTMHLSAGEEIRFIDVLYGTMLLSANDGANVIAETVSGSIPAFVDLMNETASLFGCTNTHFANAHGYHDDNHYSTARDIAIIARNAMANETFRQISSTVSYSIPRTNKQRARTITTKSEYMLQGTDEKPNKYYYQYATGIKTGSHSRSGYCFAGSATKDGVSLISVVLFTGKRARWADTIKLMNYGFSQYVSITPIELYNMNPITVETSNYSTSDTNRGRLQLVCQSSGSSPVIVATKEEVTQMAANLKDIVLIQYTRDFAAPIEAGEEIGTMTYFPDTGEPVTYQLTAARSIAKRENAPRTLEEIIRSVNEDPNPFPPFNFEFFMIFIFPLLILVSLVIFFLRLLKKKGRRKGSIPKPINRYVK